jgi:serine/threonine protein kinase
MFQSPLTHIKSTPDFLAESAAHPSETHLFRLYPCRHNIDRVSLLFFLVRVYNMPMLSFPNAAHARDRLVSSNNFASRSMHLGQTGRPVTSRSNFKGAIRAPDDLLRELQGLQIRTPANIGTYKTVTGSSTDDDSIAMNPQEIEMLTPPSTPSRAKLDGRIQSCESSGASHILELDFSPEYSQAQLLGEGVWSKVYRIPVSIPASQTTKFGRPLTPPLTPHESMSDVPSSYAIKTATRSDAAAVFQAEAQILTHIQSHASSSNYIVPFLGLCNNASSSTPSLLFHCADAGTLESLTSSTLTQPSSQTLNLFLHILPQLTQGLAFLHNTTNTIHADIKPANILLNSTKCLPDARYADFSSSFSATTTTPPSHSGAGTWSFMSPEQLVRDPNLSTPTFASDIYSLGITLLTFLCGGDPFVSLLSNTFRLREAVKMGDAITWAMQEPQYEQRLEDLQRLWEQRGGKGKLLALIVGALRKKREDRWDAGEWCCKVDEALKGLRQVKDDDVVVGLGISC